jgi:DNA polymerase-3 subunit gamma/tau
MLRQRQIAQRQAQAVADIEADGCLRGLIERFDGALDRNSISPLDS